MINYNNNNNNNNNNTNMKQKICEDDTRFKFMNFMDQHHIFLYLTILLSFFEGALDTK